MNDEDLTYLKSLVQRGITNPEQLYRRLCLYNDNADGWEPPTMDQIESAIQLFNDY